MRKINKWAFNYKGFDCEINQHSINPDFNDGNGIWCGYIYIKKQQLPDSFSKLLMKSKKTTYESMPRRWESYPLENVFNFRGGVTYYEVVRDQFSGDKVAVKVGFDLAHSWDQGCLYDEKDTEYYIKESVDAFISMFPEYLVWDRIYGEYKKPELLEEQNQ